MTVSYPDKLYYLLLRWKGSVWQMVWKQLIVWLVLWFAVRAALKEFIEPNPTWGKMAYEIISLFGGFCTNLPIVFILGFYVQQVVTRWWNQILAIPWPDDTMAFVTTALHNEEDAGAKRESVARWLVLSEAMVFRQISTRVHRRFPELENLVDAGLMTKQELAIMKESKCENTRWEMPLEWIVGKLIAPGDKLMLCATLNNFRKDLRQLFMYDWIGIPLVYTQTVAVVVYGYFAYALIGHQSLGNYTGMGAHDQHQVDLYVPWLSILQFLFYVGWFQVARELMHPFGDGDEDIELNCILDRHAAAAYSLASDISEHMPDYLLDQKEREETGRKMLNNLTYSVAATNLKDRPPKMKAYVEVEENDRKQVEKMEYQEKKFCKIFKSNTPRNFF